MVRRAVLAVGHLAEAFHASLDAATLAAGRLADPRALAVAHRILARPYIETGRHADALERMALARPASWRERLDRRMQYLESTNRLEDVSRLSDSRALQRRESEIRQALEALNLR